MIGNAFRSYAVEKLKQHAGRIDTCLGKLTEEQVWARGSENENSAANLVLHLCGNLGQWILHGVGGAPDNRNRDGEFDARGGAGIPELRARLAARVAETAAVIEGVSDERLTERIRVQNYDATVLEAIFHVVVHFGEHTGQIVFATKWFTGEDLGFYAHLRKPKHNETTP